MGKFVVKETKTGVKFDLKVSNGEVVTTSEVYASEKSCLNGIESVKKNADSKVEKEQKVITHLFSSPLILYCVDREYSYLYMRYLDRIHQ